MVCYDHCLDSLRALKNRVEYQILRKMPRKPHQRYRDGNAPIRHAEG